MERKKGVIIKNQMPNRLCVIPILIIPALLHAIHPLFTGFQPLAPALINAKK
jgi:hypothetical protein